MVVSKAEEFNPILKKIDKDLGEKGKKIQRTAPEDQYLKTEIQSREKVIKDNSRNFPITEKHKFLDWEGHSVSRKFNENRSMKLPGTTS